MGDDADAKDPAEHEVGALAGLRVLDLGRYWAGPLVGTNLGDFGADVIKIESVRAPDEWRLGGAREGPAADLDGVPGWERSAIFNSLNRNKRSISLELHRPEGRDAFLRLVREADVVVENFTPRVMAKFGLDFDRLSLENPQLVMISLPGFGMTGPQRDYLSFAYPTEEASGFPWMTGYPDGPPMLWGNAGADAVAGFFGTFAVMSALMHATETAEGVHIDLSQVESLTTCLGVELIAAQLEGSLPPRLGNRDHDAAPSGCYRNQGADEYVAITATNDEQWRALADAIGRSDLAEDPELATLAGRQAQADRIDAAIAEWAAGLPALAASDRLVAVGVPVAPVNSAEMMLADPVLAGSSLVVELDRRGNGTHRYGGHWADLSLTPPTIRRAAPWFGEHNDEVLQAGGFSADEIAALRELGILHDTLRREGGS